MTSAWRYEKCWGPNKARIVVLPEAEQDFIEAPLTVRSLLEYIGKLALVSLPSAAPPIPITSKPPSNSGKTEGLAIKTAVLADNLPQPPDSFLKTSISVIPRSGHIYSSSISPASDWLKDQVTLSQVILYCKCVELLLGLVGHSGTVWYHEKTGARERDVTIAFMHGPGMLRYPCKLKRSDSAGQATWYSPPWDGTRTTSRLSDWTLRTQKLLKQAVGYMDDVSGATNAVEMPFLCSLSCAPPNRLHVLAKMKGKEVERIVVSRNMLTVSKHDGGEALTDAKRWEAYFTTFMWVTFILAVGSLPGFPSAWEGKFGGNGKEAVEIAKRAYDHLGEKCQPPPLERVALGVRRTKNSLQRCLGQLLLQWLPLHLVFKLTSRLDIDDTNDTLAVEHNTLWRLCSMAMLPLCGGTFFSNENTDIWTFKDIGIVIKLFNSGRQEVFGRELAAYIRAEGLQGDIIPVLYGWGHSERDGLPYIVTSYVGRSIDELTPSIIATLKTDIIPKLHSKVHHHDIWEGNIVVTPEGRVMLIDLGEAVAPLDCQKGVLCPDSLAQRTLA